VSHGTLRKSDRKKAGGRAYEVCWKNKGSEFREVSGKG
jgi:hypothetical protein